jgi:hypothetical protein
MGALIQTKGTQRLARLFNDRFDDKAPGLIAARSVVSSTGTLPAAFADITLNLLTISDRFIAQNAVSGWPTDGDFLYPSATFATTTAAGGAPANTLGFTLPAGISAIPSVIATGASVCSLDARKTIPRGTVVGNVSALAGKNFTVTLVDKSTPPVPVPVVVTTNGEKISFAKTKHEKLVRRWRWYLAFDLKAENHDKIRTAIFSALDDTGFTKISFQTVEDTQKVIVTPQAKLNNASDELDNDMTMQILLLTQSTTAPDRLDSQ